VFHDSFDETSVVRTVSLLADDPIWQAVAEFSHSVCDEP
jgi:hypothetical protein